jgi:hypothetical protein
VEGGYAKQSGWVGVFEDIGTIADATEGDEQDGSIW